MSKQAYDLVDEKRAEIAGMDHVEKARLMLQWAEEQKEYWKQDKSAPEFQTARMQLHAIKLLLAEVDAQARRRRYAFKIQGLKRAYQSALGTLNEKTRELESMHYVFEWVDVAVEPAMHASKVADLAQRLKEYAKLYKRADKDFDRALTAYARFTISDRCLDALPAKANKSMHHHLTAIETIQLPLWLSQKSPKNLPSNN